MVDRIETRPFANKFNTNLQALITSPYAQQQLQRARLINHREQIVSFNDYLRSLSRRKRQRREREAITQEIVLRAIKIDQNHRRSRRHQFEVAARRAVNNNFEVLSKQYRKQSHEHKKIREKSAPGYLTNTENDGERRLRVTSAHNKISNANRDLSESKHEQNRNEPLNNLRVFSVERHACEITMSYGSKTTINTGQAVRDEIVVMQQHSTGENLVIYRGFLAKGESFSFKSQRRPTSTLSLAFYAKGFIDSIVNDCCEFKYSKRNHHSNEHSQFSVEKIRKASPCEMCRRKYSQRGLTPNIHDRSSDTIQNEQYSQKIRRRYLTLSPKPSVDNQKQVSLEKQNSNSKEHNKNTAHHKKYSIDINSISNNENNNKQITNKQKYKKVSSKSSSQQQITKERSASIDFSLLESTLVYETEQSTHLFSTKSNDLLTNKENSIRHSTEIIDDKASATSSQGEQHIQQWISQTDITSWDTLNSSDSISTLDTGNIFQMFMAHLEQLEKLPHKTQSAGVIRYEKSVENFIYILDGNLQISNEDKIKLRGLINYGFTFNDINDKKCIEYINEIVNEQIIMILSGTSMKNLDIYIRNASQLCLIYVVDDNRNWSNDFEKIRGIYTDMANVFNQLELDIPLLVDNLTTILSVPAGDTSDSAFAYIQILKDIILEIDEKPNLKKEMLDFCRQEYAGNEIQLKFIDEFEHHFRHDEAVKWYIRRESFLFKMLTRAFRIPDPDILFKLRFFIQHLHYQLKSNLSTIPMTVYRTQYISNDDFDRILKNQNGFLAFNQFLSTNKSKIIKKQQAINPSFLHSEFKLVLFQMNIETAIPRMNIETTYGDMLMTTGVVFRISTTQQDDKEIPTIILTLNSDVLRTVQEVTKNIRESARGPFPLLRIAKLMKQMDYIQHIEYFSLMLMNDPLAINNETTNLIVGGLFHTLCSFYYEQEQYDRAFEQLEKSLTVYLRVLPSDDIRLTPTYNNMGSIYHKQGLDEQALQFHKKAYDIQVNSSSPDPDSVAAYAGNIASVLVKQGKYDDAIPYLHRDLQIRQRLHPNGDGINLAVKYHNLASAQYKINNYTESLENYKKCLEIELKFHPPNHPTVAITYYNMATALEGLGQLEEGIEIIEKAVERLLLTKDENDEEIQMHKEYKKRLQQKLWVKSLFDTT